MASTPRCWPNSGHVLPGQPQGSEREPQRLVLSSSLLPAGPPRPARLTVHVTGHLAEHGQVGLIDDGAEDPPPAVLVVPEDPLPGHAEGHHPHSEEEQEEEHVDQLSGETPELRQGGAGRRGPPR